jgi:hypothetical protein
MVAKLETPNSGIKNTNNQSAKNTSEAGEQWQTIALKPEGEKPKPKTFVFVDDRYVKMVSDEIDPSAPRPSFHYEPKDASNPIHVKSAKDAQKNLDDIQSGLNWGVGKQLYDFSIGAGLKSASFVWHNSYGRMWNHATGNTAEIKRKDAEIAKIKQDIKQIPVLMANAFAYVAANPKAAASAALHAPFEHAQSLIDQGKVKEAGEFWGRALASVPLALYSGIGSVAAVRNLPNMVKATGKLIKKAKIGAMRLPKGIGKDGGRLPKANAPIVEQVITQVNTARTKVKNLPFLQKIKSRKKPAPKIGLLEHGPTFPVDRIGDGRGQGSLKKVYEITNTSENPQVVGIRYSGFKAIGNIEEEVAILRHLKKLGFPTINNPSTMMLQKNGVLKSNFNAERVMIMDAYPKGSKNLRAETYFSQSDWNNIANKNTLDSFKLIRKKFIENNIHVGDCQYEILPNGNVILTDPMGIGVGFFPSDIKLIDKYIKMTVISLRKRKS